MQKITTLTLPSFRTAYKKDIPVRIVDALLHLISAFALVKMLMHWYLPWMLLQWTPDICLLAMWPYSMVTNKYLHNSAVLVYIHKSLHSGKVLFESLVITILYAVFLCLIAKSFHTLSFIVLDFKIIFLFYCNWGVHLLIDLFTHERVSWL